MPIFRPSKPTGVPNRRSNVPSKRAGIFGETIKNIKDYKEGVPQVEHKENQDLANKARQTFF